MEILYVKWKSKRRGAIKAISLGYSSAQDPDEFSPTNKLFPVLSIFMRDLIHDLFISCNFPVLPVCKWRKSAHHFALDWHKDSPASIFDLTLRALTAPVQRVNGW